MIQKEDSGIYEILKSSKTIAVVGLSDKPDRPSYGVAKYLKEKGYEIIPVNPGHKEILGESCFGSLQEISPNVDIVLVFRRSEDTPPVAMDSVRIGAKVLWLQLGIANDEAKRIAEEAGMKVVMDRCMAIEYRRLM